MIRDTASLNLGCEEPRAETRMSLLRPSAPLANLCGVWAYKHTHTCTRLNTHREPAEIVLMGASGKHNKWPVAHSVTMTLLFG